MSRRFLLPSPERARPWWTIASIALHVVLLGFIGLSAGRSYLERTRPTLIQLIELEPPTAREFALPVPVPPTAQPETPPPVVSRARVRPVRSPDTTRVATVEAPREVPIGIPAFPSGDSAMVIGTDRVIGPAFGEGRVWVRPLEAELGIVGPSPSVAAHVARVDSALRAKIVAYIDSMPADSFATPRTDRPWTSEVDGETWGVDGQWIYLGDIKLPSALLALLPFPQGNYYEAKAEQELMRIRADIIRAARASENAEDFKDYVEQVRRRKQQERDAERARREAAARDTVIP